MKRNKILAMGLVLLILISALSGCIFKETQEPVDESINEPVEEIQKLKLFASGYMYRTEDLGNNHRVIILQDGTVKATGNNEYGQCDVEEWEDIVSVAVGEKFTLGLKENGTVVAAGYNSHRELNITELEGVKAIAAGDYFTLALMENGDVQAFGINTHGQCNVKDWHNIIQIEAGSSHTVGLKEDGTVVAVGSNVTGQTITSLWKDVVKISAKSGQTAGLRRDGTVLYAGENPYTLESHKELNCIVDIDTGINMLAAVRNDGSLWVMGNDSTAFEPMKTYDNIEKVLAGLDAVYPYTSERSLYGNFIDGSYKTWEDIIKFEPFIGLSASGRVYAYGDNRYNQLNVYNWRFIADIESNLHTVGLKANGSCIATGKNDFGQCEVFDWADIKDIAIGENHTLGLKADGTVIAAGDNTYGQCDVLGWTNIAKVYAKDNFSIGITKDGSLVFTGKEILETKEFLTWSNIQEIKTSSQEIFALTKNGEILYEGLDGKYKTENYRIENIPEGISYISVCDKGIYLANSEFVYYMAADNTNTASGTALSSEIYGISGNNSGVYLLNKEDGISYSAIADVFTEKINSAGTDIPVDLYSFSNIRKIASGKGHIVGLRKDGTVMAQGINSNSQLEVSGWTDIIDICAGDTFTLGLKKDGSVVMAGTLGDNDLSDWVNITDISGAGNYAVGIKEDKTMVDLGQITANPVDIRELTDVVQAETDGKDVLIILKRDGSVKVLGNPQYGLSMANKWQSVTAIVFRAPDYLIGVTPGGNWDVSPYNYNKFTTSPNENPYDDVRPEVTVNEYGEYIHIPFELPIRGVDYVVDEYPCFNTYIGITRDGRLVATDLKAPKIS